MATAELMRQALLSAIDHAVAIPIDEDRQVRAFAAYLAGYLGKDEPEVSKGIERILGITLAEADGA